MGHRLLLTLPCAESFVFKAFNTVSSAGWQGCSTDIASCTATVAGFPLPACMPANVLFVVSNYPVAGGRRAHGCPRWRAGHWAAPDVDVRGLRGAGS